MKIRLALSPIEVILSHPVGCLMHRSETGSKMFRELLKAIVAAPSFLR